ncbi:helix-turn-helix transcriptional regulator [Rhizobium lusitanum]|jgi:ArsR family transcriptional regulator|uniref:ArsR/SmtB family transcription factor n=1 Tax=Rhizobium lusitanum TaxID=293958 RepID=UPI0016159AAA|nr:metalloregulator ArsR/SmtB family transcription factor [Rhizobium lusitanum]QND47741.1 helix-turn-helix transcriptional regulator [Rhizobium lusitanum]
MDRTEILKALAHPARLEILNHLKDPNTYFPTQEHPLELGVCASQFERCGLSQSTVSAHLGTLLRAELVTTKRLGQWIFYKRNEETIAEFLATLQKEL